MSRALASLLAPTITIVDVDAGIPVAEIDAACLALTNQALQHWAPAWGTSAVVRGTADGPPLPGEWQLQLRKAPTIQGALGFHDRAEDGTPILYVFPELCAQTGTSWTSCASHEILEALGDPLLRRLAQAPDNAVWALEVCDAVESDTYKIGDVEVSNFVTPAWFEPRTSGGETYDHLGRCTKPYEIRDGGYGQTWDPSKGWSQVGEMRAYRKALAELGISRGARRVGAKT